jgi:hypothetical protein
VVPQPSGRARATELLNLLENLCCTEFLLRYEDEALCSRFDAARDMAFMGVRPAPKAVLSSRSFQECFEALGGKLQIEKQWKGFAIGPSGRISSERFRANSEQYQKLREDLLQSLSEHGASLEAYLRDPEAV